jgi:hypothetical protein
MLVVGAHTGFERLRLAGERVLHRTVPAGLLQCLRDRGAAGNRGRVRESGRKPRRGARGRS